MSKKAQPKMLSPKDLNKKFVDSMKKVAKMLDKEPCEVTRAELVANDPNELSVWQLRAAGGFDNLKKLYFQKEADPVATSGSRMIAEHRKRLEKTVGDRIFTFEELRDSIIEAVSISKIPVHTSTKKVNLNKKKGSKKRTIVAHLSDTHFGANIESSEVGEVNEFNWSIAARRLGLFAEQIATYKTQYRKDTDLVLLINGDIIAGVIHNQEWFVDLLTDQFAGTVKNLTQFISYLANHFDKVKVYCTSGNHGRAMHKGSKDRGTTHKWDSYETMIYMTVKSLVEQQFRNVVVDIPKSPYAIFKLYNKNFFVTHGDTIVNLGNPGRSINIKDISNQINKLNASSLGGSNQKFDAVICGHHHTPTVQLTDTGCMLVINGCLSGADPYAQSVGYFDAIPTQQLFEVTEAHAVGDMRFITLSEADLELKYEQIIEPYKKV